MSKKYMEYEDLVYYDKKIKEYINNFSGNADGDVTKNLITGVYISEEIEDIKLTKIYQGSV